MNNLNDTQYSNFDPITLTAGLSGIGKSVGNIIGKSQDNKLAQTGNISAQIELANSMIKSEENKEKNKTIIKIVVIVVLAIVIFGSIFYLTKKK